MEVGVHLEVGVSQPGIGLQLLVTQLHDIPNILVVSSGTFQPIKQELCGFKESETETRISFVSTVGKVLFHYPQLTATRSGRIKIVNFCVNLVLRSLFHQKQQGQEN